MRIKAKNNLGRKTGLKCLCCLLVINFVCLLLTGCAADNGGNGQGTGGTADNPASDPDGRTVLTVAVMWRCPRQILERINAYNESSQAYYIEIKEYGSESPDKTAEDIQAQLAMEILAGKGPDLALWDFAGAAVPYSPSVASGKLMVNLYDFMEADPDFHREDYYENILQAFELDGGLYTLPTGFVVDTVCGRAEEIGVDKGVTESWDIGEMIEAFENSPHTEWLTMNNSKNLTFFSVCQGCIGNFVDWDSGECHFDTPAFVELLEFSDTFPDQLIIHEEDSYYETLRSGKVLWDPVLLTSPWEVADMRISFGDVEMRWPGYPVAEGEKDFGGGVAQPYGECFSICRSSNHQEAAWEFIKSYLTVEAQRDVAGIPLLRSVSEERIQDALTLEYETVDGVRQEKSKYEILAYGEDPIELSCITEEDAQLYRSIIESIRRSYGSDPGMIEIIREEAAVYFEKDRDAAGVAEIIQNRVSVYVSERL